MPKYLLVLFQKEFSQFLNFYKMPTTPSKLNISFGRNSYSVFGSRCNGGNTKQQQEQKTELLEGKGQLLFIEKKIF